MRVLVVFIGCLLFISGGVFGMYDPRIASFTSVTPNVKEWVKNVPRAQRVATLEMKVSVLEAKIANLERIISKNGLK